MFLDRSDPVSPADFDALVVGCGFSGATVARTLADAGRRVLVLEEKAEVGGMMADFTDANGICIHKYGPHVFMLNSDEVRDWLTRFCTLRPVVNYVHAFIDGKYVSIPANFHSLDALYGTEKSLRLQKKLLARYGEGAQVHILALRDDPDPEVRAMADDLYAKIFVGYNAKMWGLKPEELDPSIPGRLPVRIAYNNKNCRKKYELVPDEGYASLFSRLLDSPNIAVSLRTKASERLRVAGDRLELDGRPFDRPVAYTAPLDELFAFEFGPLPYRALRFEFDVRPGPRAAPSAVTTFPLDFDKVRTTDMVELLGQNRVSGFVADVSEFPGPYAPGNGPFNVPAYPVLNDASAGLLARYREKAAAVPNLFPVGRLAEFKYFDMEAAISSALACANRILKGDSNV
jgi:UDP-galactopyranose mutase